jgi:hypothetical protein
MFIRSIRSATTTSNIDRGLLADSFDSSDYPEPGDRIESMCVDANERFVFTGHKSGKIRAFTAETLTPLCSVQAQHGSIQAIAYCKSSGSILSLSQDQSVAHTILRYKDNSCELVCIDRVSILGIPTTNASNKYRDTKSGSQALCIHPSRARVATRSGCSAIIEFDIEPDTGQLKLVSSRRISHQGSDLTATCYVPGTSAILSGYNNGYLCLSDGDALIQEWKISDGREQVHRIVHAGGDDYFISGDFMFVCHLNLATKELIVGPRFGLDEQEHIFFEPTTNRLFLTSFDRNVYEIDPLTCEPKHIVYKAPFKCRWLHASSKDPDKLYLQVQHSSVEIISLRTGECRYRVSFGPRAYWSSTFDNKGQLVMAGEGQYLTIYRKNSQRVQLGDFQFERQKVPLTSYQGGYFKRIQASPNTNLVYLGCSTGAIHSFDGNSDRIEFQLKGAVRDLLVIDEFLYVCTEQSEFVRYNTITSKMLSFTSQMNIPYWAIAGSPCQDRIFLFERKGGILVIRRSDMSLECRLDYPISFDTRDIHNRKRPKRAKWISPDMVIYSSGYCLNVLNPVSLVQAELVPRTTNTIEDFIVDEARNLLITCGYDRTLRLIHLSSGTILSESSDQIDVSKGLTWFPTLSEQSSEGCSDILTFGRGGEPKLFRISEESIFCIGPIDRL